MSPPPATRARRLLPAALAVYGVIAAAGLVYFFHLRQPISTWYALDLFRWWSGTLVASAAWLCGGRRLLELAGARTLRIRQRWALSFGLGVPLFVFGEWLAGAVGLLNKPFAVIWALLLIAAGIAPVRRDFAEWRRRTVAPTNPLAWLLLATGVLALGWLYLGILTPDAVNYDAKWNHLVIAENYAREGRIFGFAADWNRNMPHLGSLVSTWAFLWPGASVAPQQWVQALHLEFAMLCLTLFAITGVMELFWPRRMPSSAWVVVVLFPAISVYDSNLGASSDHHTAFFACPLALATAWGSRVPNLRRIAVWGAIAGAAMATKLQGFYLVVPAGLWLFASVAWRAAKRQKPQALKPLAGAALGFGFSFGPHALRNLIAFGNPLYPMAQNWLGGTPTIPNAHEQIMTLLAAYAHHAPEPLAEKLPAAAKLLFTFAFQPHYSFVNDAPIFGALFTLMTPLLPWVASRRRALLLLFCAWGALAAWALTYWVDRNAQTFAPLLWAATAVTARGLWLKGTLPRVGAVAMISAQLVTGTDMVFTASDRVNSSISLLRSSYDKRAEHRWDNWGGSERALRDQLPPDANVVLHNGHVTLGWERRTLLDWVGFQGLFDYRQMKSIADVERALVKGGGTHLVFLRCNRGTATRQEEVLFSLYAAATEPKHHQAAYFTWWPLEAAPSPPLSDKPLTVWLRTQFPYADGAYRIEQLTANYEGPKSWQVAPSGPITPAPKPEEIDAVLIPDWDKFPAELDASQFIRVQNCAAAQVFGRKSLFAQTPQSR